MILQTDADVSIQRRRAADARSITGVLGLGAPVGDELTCERGSDALGALAAVPALVTIGSD